ncbi:ABC-type multidrug transport system, ATPase and permease component [Halorhabdus sp. SVX81]|uniref:ABC transporter ATP-binding protein n=1 Tax=Halorhabdus sp. SVX81 TaxID=2978283 RepID=UPI0023DA5EF0|nr:ABC transporter ATP-binding protein [Halorhabdus sp. SVX81]WEL16665.1 ABC-type multidrug transport system, ATPase and permease component [Halorhabdus sp. SVX81]
MYKDLFDREKLSALWRVAKFRPFLTVGIVVLSVFAAILEGIGLSFLLPIINQARDGGGDPGAIGEAFLTTYDVLSVPYTLETIIAGVALVMIFRYVSSFFVAWLRELLRTIYVRDLQGRAFEGTLNAEVAYFDREGSDDVLNAIVTQAREASLVIYHGAQFLEQILLSAMYITIALILAPWLTLGTGVVLGALLLLLRFGLASGYTVGDRVAAANEQLQRVVQAGTQGIRDVKLFGLSEELYDNFEAVADRFVDARVHLRRNQAAMDNLYQLITAITVFVLIYVALRFSDLPLEKLGVFLFAMFRLTPRLSSLNTMVYQLEGNLPHLVRTQRFIDDLDAHREGSTGGESVPEPVDELDVDDVSFAYRGDEGTIQDVSFSVDRGEFVAFVGASGAGKSTIVALLSRLYRPDDGEIRADGVPIERFDIQAWRDRLAVVRQSPYIFNDTLRYNVTVGNRSATMDEIEQVCEVAQVTEFLDELADGYDTELGDEGVRLSGGQKQRVALARALLCDADFLLLDEATSDLDTNIEREVQQAIENLQRDQGMVVVAHRLSTVRNADRIYTMESGEITEVGTHAELIAEDGTYAELYATQDTGS